MRLGIAAAAALVLSTGTAFADCNLAAPDAAAAGPGCARAWMDENLRVNDIVTVGTHNSYKAAIPDKLMGLIRMGGAQGAQALDYSHPPLADQLNDGARTLEFDLYYDPQGGLYAHAAGAAMTGLSVTDAYVAAMSKPGFKVMHVEDVDYGSICVTFVACLGDLKTWSAKHPDHVPILVIVKARDAEIPMPGSVTPLKFDAAAFDALDAEILSVFRAGQLITPDQVQAGAPTLRDSVLAHGWPTLGASRGKFIFALNADSEKAALYRGGRASLEGRLMFVNVPSDSPAAAYLVVNGLEDMPHIAADVQKGFLVRTRADVDTVEARVNDTARRDKALASGAQYISTDYMRPDTRFGPYQVRMPPGVIAACNPQRNPARCAGLPVEAATP